jgi:hypothetical protein
VPWSNAIVTEIGTAWVKSLVQAKAGHTLYIARITAVEITSAITRRQHGRDLSAGQAGKGIARLPVSPCAVGHELVTHL